jgi:hypothetical protein
MIVLLVLSAVMGYLFKKGEGLGDTRSKFLVDYKKIPCPAHLPYETIKQGKFYTDDLEIDRKETVQTQFNKERQSTDVFNVSWLSPSEYMLTNPTDPAKNIFVKIVAIDDSSYTCYFCYDTISSPPTYFTKIRKQ